MKTLARLTFVLMATLLPADDLRFLTVDPGHFHAALVQKEMYAELSPKVSIYAPLGPDLINHLNRILRFNTRAEKPTSWELDIHTGPDYFERMLHDHKRGVVVLSGRNRPKIDRIQRSVEAGLNVLADKPWIISAADMPKLEAVLERARSKGLIAFDIMTERHEAMYMLQRELVNDREIFGTVVAGDREHPAVVQDSTHQIMKLVAGAPNLRPAWFFDIDEQGEGISDVGTHFVDQIHWTLFPEQSIDYRKDIQVLAGSRWPTQITRDQFRRVTAEPDFPSSLAGRLKEGALPYYCNNSVTYTVRGIHAQVRTVWMFDDAATRPDTHVTLFRGSKSRIELRQGEPEKYRREIYIVPNSADLKAEISAALTRRLRALQASFAGVGFEDAGAAFRLTVPDSLRIGHEEHFAKVVDEFLRYVKDPKSIPAWETSLMTAKYYVTTHGVAEALRSGTR